MTLFQPQFESLLKSLPSQGSEWLELRQQSFRRFQELGFPNRKWEDWQFTNFTPLKKTPFSLAKPPDQISDLKKLIPSLYRNHYLVILNGHFQPALSTLPTRIKVHDLLSEPETNFPSVPAQNHNPFKALNAALTTANLMVEVPAGTTLKHPLYLLYLTTDSRNPTMSHPRVRFTVGADSNITFYEHYLSRTNHLYWNNLVTEIEVDKRASLHHFVIIEEGSKANHIAAVDYRLTRNSRLNAFQYSVSGHLNRTDITLSMAGEGSEGTLSGLTLLKDQQHADLHMVVDHLKPHGTSQQTFRNILTDHSSGVFNGRVIVRSGSQKTDARQGNKNLLLSDQALMHSNPQLEIYADDVKCTHGSSSGQLDEEALFYLQTRGINKTNARQLIVLGFARELFKKLPLDRHGAYFESLLENWLEAVYASNKRK